MSKPPPASSTLSAVDHLISYATTRFWSAVPIFFRMCPMHSVLPAGRRAVCSRLVLRLLCSFRICWYILFVHPHLSHVQYLRHVDYCHATLLLVEFGNLDGCFE